MISFRKYLVNEMPKALKDAAISGDEGKFKQELKQAFFKTKGSLENPGSAAYHFQGAKNVQIHDGGEKGGKMWPYLTFDMEKPDGTSSNVVVSVPNEADVTNITDFDFVVGGVKKGFSTTTTKDQKRTGDIAAGSSYILSGLKQSIFGGKRKEASENKRKKAIEDMTDEELKAILSARAAKNAPPAEVKAAAKTLKARAKGKATEEEEE